MSISNKRGKILVGTASWSDPGFIADWYPKSVAASERLRFYAQFFNLVELNSSFYGIPNQRQAERWCEQTPTGFVFDVKLHKLLSRHSAKPDSLPPDLRKKAELFGDKLSLTPKIEAAVAARFLEEITPLSEAGKLGALLLQLSPVFSPRNHKLEELEHLFGLFEKQKLAVELRNRSWVKDERIGKTVEFFEKQRVSWVVVDAPESEHFMVMPTISVVTNPQLAYMRMHGRNEEGFVKGRTVAERFNYLYSDEELKGIKEKVVEIAAEARETHVIYNNNASDYAIQSAMKFQSMIGAKPRTKVID
ncbi:MAG: DUF72 domain-containing protein [Verrucomicrobiales bacterium]